ncbi:MAG: hypothetical protein WCF90_04595 [Methanomicrobiales archaeon]
MQHIADDLHIGLPGYNIPGCQVRFGAGIDLQGLIIGIFSKCWTNHWACEEYR